MNIILFERDETAGATVQLKGRRAEHIIKILKSKTGDQVRTGIINGPMGSATISHLSTTGVELVLNDHHRQAAPPLVDIVLALPRPIMLKRVLAQVATFGVGHLFLINSNRVEKSFFSASLLHEAKIRKRLLEGLEQAGDTLLPQVTIQPRFRPFVEDILPEMAARYQEILLAHPDAPASLSRLLPPPLQGRVLLIIGPEGGWVDYEVDLFKAQGVRVFHLGPRIFRVDSIIPSLLGQLDLLRQLPSALFP